MSYRPPVQPPRDNGARLGFWAWYLFPAVLVITALLGRGCS